MKKQLGYSLMTLCIALPLTSNQASAGFWGSVGEFFHSVASTAVAAEFCISSAENTCQGQLSQGVQEGQKATGTGPHKPTPAKITMQNINIQQAAKDDGVRPTTAEEATVSTNIKGSETQSSTALKNVINLTKGMLNNQVITANQVAINDGNTSSEQSDGTYSAGQFGSADIPDYQPSTADSYIIVNKQHGQSVKVPLIAPF